VGAVVNRFILLGFLLLMSIDTASQVCIKLAGNRIGPFEFQATWLARATAEPLIYLVLLFFGCSFVVYITLLKYAPVGPAYAAAHSHIVSVLMVSIFVFGENTKSDAGSRSYGNHGRGDDPGRYRRPSQ